MVSYGTGLFGRRPFGRCQLTSLGSDPVYCFRKELDVAYKKTNGGIQH